MFLAYQGVKGDATIPLLVRFGRSLTKERG